MAKDRRDWGTYESDSEWNRAIREDLERQRTLSQRDRGFIERLSPEIKEKLLGRYDRGKVAEYL